MTRILLTLLLCLAPALAWAHGDTFPSTDTTVIAIIDANGNVVNPGDDTNRAIRTTIVSGSGGTAVGGCTSTAAAPSYVEGEESAISCDLSGNVRYTNGTLGSGEYQGTSQLNSRLQTGGAQIITDTLASAVTTNTTSTAVIAYTGPKTIYGQVVCSSGACTQTQAIYGDIDNDAANGILLCTLTLSGTTRAQDACTVITAAFKYLYVVTTATTGTSAAGALYVQY